MTPATLTTDRLILQPLSPNHAAELHAVYSHPDAMRFMDTPPHPTLAVTQAKVAEMMTPPAQYWSLALRQTGRVIGNVGYLGNAGVPGFGYIIHPDYWRQGYTGEAIRAAITHGFTEMGLDRVELWINDANIASQKLAEKVGFTRRSQFRMRYPHEAQPHDKLVYGLFRYEWAARPGTAPVQPRQGYQLQPVLAVSDVAITARFYRDQLGFEIDFLFGDPPIHGAVSCKEWSTEGIIIQLSQSEQTDLTGAGVALYLFVGPDIDARLARYQAAGVTIANPIDTYGWGMREFDILDCNGYRLRFGTAA